MSIEMHHRVLSIIDDFSKQAEKENVNAWTRGNGTKDSGVIVGARQVIAQDVEDGEEGEGGNSNDENDDIV
eukprot:13178966-Ditylum_brightwellii.AAC.1